MRTSGKQGFTLIELLIVIAIIGILAAVLIPNLMNARVTAGQRAAQAHSSTVYTAAMAALAEHVQFGPGDVSVNCQTGAAVVLGSGAGSVTSSYTVNATPANTTCAVAANTGGTDVEATVIYGAGTPNARTYVNGVQTAP